MWEQATRCSSHAPLQAGRNFTDSFAGREPVGPLEDHEAVPDLLKLKTWSEQRREGAIRHLRIVAEIVSEASQSFFEPEEGLALLLVAKEFFAEEAVVAERSRALAIFQGTFDRLSDGNL